MELWHEDFGKVALIGDLSSAVWVTDAGVWFGQFRTIPWGAVVNLPLSEVTRYNGQE